MKKILPLILILTMTSTGFCWPFGKKNPQPKPSPTPVVSVTKATPSSGKNILEQLKSELIGAKKSNASLQSSLEKAKAEIEKAKEETVAAQKAADALKEWGIIQQAEAQKYFEKYTATIKRYHKLKNIAAIVAGAFGAMLGMWCMRLVPPVYAAYAFTLPIAGAILAFGAVWMFF